MKMFRLPDLGEGLQEAQIVEWHAREGEDIASDAPLLSVETDKAVTEVPAPWSGRISRLCAKAGEVVKVGAALVEFEGRDQEPAVVAKPAPSSVPLAAKTSSAGRAMPAVRLLARELGLDLAAISGTGPEGTILVRDVAAAFKNASLPSPGATGGHTPLSGIRRSMALKMTRSGQEVVPATVHEEADLGEWPRRSGLTVRLVRAIARAIAAEPVLNAHFDQAQGLQVSKGLHLGIAVDSADGLLVPVLRDAETVPADALAPRPRKPLRRREDETYQTPGSQGRDLHALQLWNDRRPPCDTGRHSPAGGDPRGGPPHRPGGGESRRAGREAHFALVAEL